MGVSSVNATAHIHPYTFHVLHPVKDTFARAKNWVRELQRQASPNIVIALSGNKVDLASKRAVDFEVRKRGFVFDAV